MALISLRYQKLRMVNEMATSTTPYKNSPATLYLAERIKDLSHRKTQAEIAAEAGFVNSNMLSMIKSGRNKIPLDRIPSLATALECDRAKLMTLALEQAVGVTSAKAITDIFGLAVTTNERGWIEELREASEGTDPRLTARSRAGLRGIFGK